MPLTPQDVLSNLAGARIYAPEPQAAPVMGASEGLVRAIADAILAAVSQGYERGIQHGVLQSLVQQAQAAPAQPEVPPGAVLAQASAQAPVPAPAQVPPQPRVSVRNLFSWNPKVGALQPASPMRQPSETYLTRQALENILARIGVGRR